MQIIKLNAIGSTNAYAKELASSYNAAEPIVIWAKNQTDGRGQRGTLWSSKEGESLTFSVLIRPSKILLTDQFCISMLVSVAIAEVLSIRQIPKIKIKWPNDILADNKKIGGILIENSAKGAHIDTCVIGFGLNVNQQKLADLPKASSMKGITGKQYDLEELLLELVNAITSELTAFNLENMEQLKARYLNYLFRKDKPSSFNVSDQDQLPGIIRGINEHGALLVQFENEQLKAFNLKEIELLY